MLINYLLNALEMNQINIDVFLENKNACGLYKKLKFKEVELLENFWTDETGKVHNLLMMTLKKDDFFRG